MKTLRVVVRTVDVSTYEIEVEDDFPSEPGSRVTEAAVTEAWYEDGFDWPRVDSEQIDEEIIEFEIVG